MPRMLIAAAAVAAMLTGVASQAHAGTCKVDEDCPGFPDELCGVDGFCKFGGGGGECKLDEDCPGFPDEFCDAAGFCKFGGGGLECKFDDDCLGFPDEYCDAAGFCQSKALLGECEFDTDCGVGEYCDFDGLCELADFSGSECILDSDCLGFPDEFCFDGLCYGTGEEIIIDKGIVECEDDLDCPGDSICDVDFFCTATTVVVDDGILGEYVVTGGGGPVVTASAGCSVSGTPGSAPAGGLMGLSVLGVLVLISRRRKRR
jgi:MYXO-CTERM domain-containing protein